MQLSFLMDFPDDARTNVFSEETMYKMMARLKKAGFTRGYFQYYGNRDYGYFWDHRAPVHKKTVETAELMPEPSRVFVEAAKANGIEPVAVMRPQEQGNWVTFSPFYEEARTNPGVPAVGGKVMMASKFLMQNPELRIKRRAWDMDPGAVEKTISTIKIRKQNNSHSRIGKRDITIYVSDDNSHYRKYPCDFSMSFEKVLVSEDVVVSKFEMDYPSRILSCAGDEVEVLVLRGLAIDERYVAIGVKCEGDADGDVQFTNATAHMISIYGVDQREISASPGSAVRKTPTGDPHLEAGFSFNDGFGDNWAVTLDPNGDEGFIAICKGKDEYVHGALCACEPKVRKYWLHWLEKALDDGYDMVGNRIECHSVMVDEPFAYGYNDCIKEEYFRRFGSCAEQDMDLRRIATIRGDAYTDLFIEGAKRVRARGKKVYATLNVEQLYDPIPFVRRCAYPMNVEWQWRRWLEEVRPDEINIRSYCTSIDFILHDSQCREFIQTAQKYNVPLTLERYCYWDFAAEFEMVRDTQIFSRMTLYETNNIIQSDGRGGIIEIEPELLRKLEALINKNTY